MLFSVAWLCILKKEERNHFDTRGRRIQTTSSGRSGVFNTVVKSAEGNAFFRCSNLTIDLGTDAQGFATTILQIYTYEVYGQIVAIHNAIAGGVTTGALTSLQYSGEQFDSRIGQQYLRARYYDPNTGRFNRLDPFAGNMNDPQSLHKYLYTQANPVTGIDPGGRWTITSSISVGAISGGIAGLSIGTVYGVYKTGKLFSP
ncbi:hypothetical protein GC197_16240 [bacterium]|nr:hypothetical protein [bacterium]